LVTFFFDKNRTKQKMITLIANPYFEFSSWLIVFWQFHPSLFNFVKFSYYIWCLFFFIIHLKSNPRVDPYHVLGQWLGQMIEVTSVNRIFYYVVSKNNIILIKKNNSKKIINRFWYDFPLAHHLIFYSSKM